MKPLQISAFAAAAFLAAAPVLAAVKFPAPEDAVVTTVGENMTFNGATMSAWELRSDKSPQDVLAFYRKEWGSGGPDGGVAYVEKQFGGWNILTHVEDDDVYTVQVQPGAMKKGTFALLGVSDMSSRRIGQDVGKDFPKLPGSTVQSDLVSQDQGVRSRTIMMTNGASVQQNLDFYTKHFFEKGWNVETGMRDAQNNAGTIVASLNGSRWQLTLVPGRNETSLVGVLEER
jgi:hypothetical protein